MARSRQAPSRVRLPDPPAAYDPQYMRELVSSIEAELQRIASPISKLFSVVDRSGVDFRTLPADGSATLEATSKFLGELAAEMISANKLGGSVTET